MVSQYNTKKLPLVLNRSSDLALSYLEWQAEAFRTLPTECGSTRGKGALLICRIAVYPEADDIKTVVRVWGEQAMTGPG